MEFLASLPSIQSAITIGQDGARIVLEIPETELPKMLALVLHRGKVLRVHIEPEEADGAQVDEDETLIQEQGVEL